jgi:hypothetical protein
MPRGDVVDFRTLRMESLESRRVLDASLAADLSAEGEGQPAADFQLPDVNSTSPTFGQQVSPRDYLGQTSAWYFGHST